MKIAGSGFAYGPKSDPLVRGRDPWIRIRKKISWICKKSPRLPKSGRYLGEGEDYVEAVGEENS
jgi:hypothetical protein